MSECNGLRPECKDIRNINWCGNGTFSCSFWNNSKGECELKHKTTTINV